MLLPPDTGRCAYLLGILVPTLEGWKAGFNWDVDVVLKCQCQFVSCWSSDRWFSGDCVLCSNVNSKV